MEDKHQLGQLRSLFNLDDEELQRIWASQADYNSLPFRHRDIKQALPKLVVARTMLEAAGEYAST